MSAVVWPHHTHYLPLTKHELSPWYTQVLQVSFEKGLIDPNCELMSSLCWLAKSDDHRDRRQQIRLGISLKQVKPAIIHDRLLDSAMVNE